jgi:hypothetical protein
MENQEDALEILWGQLLSRQAALVRAAYARLEPDDQQAVVTHLRRMSAEAGWHPEQRKSARSALRALNSLLTKTP